MTVGIRVRAAMSKFYFEDRISPATQTEIDEATHHNHEIEAEVKKAIEG
jgi:ubiquinol-cytochrome c reductase cytochrome b subunit